MKQRETCSVGLSSVPVFASPLRGPSPRPTPSGLVYSSTVVYLCPSRPTRRSPTLSLSLSLALSLAALLPWPPGMLTASAPPQRNPTTYAAHGRPGSPDAEVECALARVRVDCENLCAHAVHDMWCPSTCVGRRSCKGLHNGGMHHATKSAGEGELNSPG